MRLQEHRIAKLEALFNSWRSLRKEKKESAVQRQREDFEDHLDALFDMAHQDALHMITIEENSSC